MNTLSRIPDMEAPEPLFRAWLDEAFSHESDVPDAMSLATVAADGQPSVRMVLLKEFDARGFVFYTNSHSRKGHDIAANPKGALCFHWKSLGRQVRAEGLLNFVTDTESDAYWASRPRGSQIAAWASDQSEAIAAGQTLEQRVTVIEQRFAGQSVPRPPHWKGYRLVAERIEFWLNVANRLHDRLVFHRDGDGWRTERLYP